MTKPKNEGQYPNGTPYRGEVDWVNERVARACAVPLKFLYPPDPVHPSRRANLMELEAYTQIQRDHDTRNEVVVTPCTGCGQQTERPKNGRRILTIAQTEAMSEAWSRKLRAKVEESDRLREAKKPQICVEIDDYWD